MEIQHNSFKNKIILNKYQIGEKQNNSKHSNIEIYQTKNIITDEMATIKIETINGENKQSILSTEAHFLYYLKGSGIPILKEIFYYDKQYLILIESSLGKTLNELFKEHYSNFDIKDITMSSIQILERLKFVHSKNIILCDVQPKNFCLGPKNYENIIYIKNLENAQYFRNKKTLQHNKNKFGSENKNLYLSSKFSSINGMRKNSLSRRDDLESLGYILIYFLIGNLPWQNIKALNKNEKNRKIYQAKKNMDINNLPKKIPNEYILYVNYVKTLKFEDEPDYNYCFNLFYEIFNKILVINDGIFTWYQGRKSIDPEKSKKYFNYLRTFKNSSHKNIKSNLDFDKNVKVLKKSNSEILCIHSQSINNIKPSIKKKNNEINNDDIIKININEDNIQNDHENRMSIDNDTLNENLKNIDIYNTLSFSFEKDYSIEAQVDPIIKIKKTQKNKSKIGLKNNSISKNDFFFNNNNINNNNPIYSSRNKIKRINSDLEKLETIHNTLIKMQQSINESKQKEKSFYSRMQSNKILKNKNKSVIFKNITSHNILNSSKSELFKNEIISQMKQKMKSKTKNVSPCRKKFHCTQFSHLEQAKKYINAKSKKVLNKTNLIENIDDKQNKLISLNTEDYLQTNRNNRRRINSSINNSSKNTYSFNSINDLNAFKKKMKNNSSPYQSSYNNITYRKTSNKCLYGMSLGSLNMIKENKPKSNIKTPNNRNKLVIKNNYNILTDIEKKIFDRQNSIYKKTHKKNISVSNSIINSNIQTIQNTLKNDIFSCNKMYSNNKKLINENNAIPLYKKPNINIGFKNNSTIKRLNTKKIIKNSFDKIESTTNRNSKKYIHKKYINKNPITQSGKNSDLKKIYFLYENKKMPNCVFIKKNKNLFNTGLLENYIRMGKRNQPIIHNSISKINVIQNVSNIYVSNSYLEGKNFNKNNSMSDENKVYQKRKSDVNVVYRDHSKKDTEWVQLSGNSARKVTNLILKLKNNDNANNYYCINNSNKNNFLPQNKLLVHK